MSSNSNLKPDSNTSNSNNSKKRSAELLYIDDENSPFNLSKKEKPKIQKVGQSSILSKAQDFLTQIKAENEKLQEKIDKGNADDLNIENINKNESHVIEMNLTLGILEEKKKEEKVLEIKLPGQSKVSDENSSLAGEIGLKVIGNMQDESEEEEDEEEDESEESEEEDSEEYEDDSEEEEEEDSEEEGSDDKSEEDNK